MNAARVAVRATGAVLRHPALWRTALVQYHRLLPDDWWRQAPFLPLPDPAILRFRASTHYGNPDHPPASEDLITWLRWCKAEDQRRRVR